MKSKTLKARLRRLVRRFFCLFGFHQWYTIYRNGVRIVQFCPWCERHRSTMYSSCFGTMHWEPGDRWSHLHKHGQDGGWIV